MFFSTYVLTKKGPLAKVWLAAHWDKRLTRHEVKVVNLTQTIVHIIRPVVPIALRTSGELLVGVVRIYALKVKHLLREANDAVLLLRMASITVKGTGVQRVSGQSKWLWSNGAETPQDKATRMITSKDMNGGEIGAEDIERAAIEGPGSANAAAQSAAALYQSEVHAVTYDWGNTIAAAAAATTTTSASLQQHRRSEVSAAGVAANVSNSGDEAAFRAIADLLQPGSSHERPFTSSAAHATATAAAASQVSSSAAAGNALTAWYTMEPSSQDAALTGNGAGGMYASQSQAYEEIARMRADLMAMQPQQKEGTAFPWLAGAAAAAQRESSTSQSSGSLARANGAPRGLGSIEFARGSAGGEYNNTGLPYPLPLPYPNGDEELDIGVPLPELEEQDRLLHGNGGNMTPGHEGDVAGGRPSGFPFYNPNALQGNAPLHPSATTTTQAHTNANAMPVIDLTSTTLSRAVVERTMKECGDILLKAPRRGPYTMDELQDRCLVLAASAPQSSSANSNGNEIWLRLLPRTLLSRSVFSCAQITSPLSEAYSKALEAPLQTTCATLRERLAARKASMTMNMIARNNAAPARSPQYTSGADEIPAEGLEAFLAMTSHDALGEDAAATSTRKRLREGSSSSSSSSETEKLTALSATANRTLQRIRATIEADEATGANKRLRREGSVTESASCTLEKICTGLRRREAARTFVDILALASCSLLRAEQTSMDRGEVRLTLREGPSMNNNNNDRAGVAAAAERGRDVPAAVVAAAA